MIQTVIEEISNNVARRIKDGLKNDRYSVGFNYHPSSILCRYDNEIYQLQKKDFAKNIAAIMQSDEFETMVTKFNQDYQPCVITITGPFAVSNHYGQPSSPFCMGIDIKIKDTWFESLAKQAIAFVDRQFRPDASYTIISNV